MSILAEKAGEVHVRVGGNTQEYAYFVDELPEGKFLLKNKEDARNPVRDTCSTQPPFESHGIV